MNPRTLRQQAAKESAKAQYHAKRAAFLEQTANQLEALTAGDKSRKDSHMHVAKESPRRVGRPSTSAHPFRVALEARGETMAAFAAKHGYTKPIVRAWFTPGPSGRRIPSEAARLIEREYGVPATEAVWLNGIR